MEKEEYTVLEIEKNGVSETDYLKWVQKLAKKNEEILNKSEFQTEPHKEGKR